MRRHYVDRMLGTARAGAGRPPRLLRPGARAAKRGAAAGAGERGRTRVGRPVDRARGRARGRARRRPCRARRGSLAGVRRRGPRCSGCPGRRSPTSPIRRRWRRSRRASTATSPAGRPRSARTCATSGSSAAGRELRSFGSQGEQRATVLALTLAEADLTAERRGAPPLLLLDDVLSELDETRRAALLAALPAGIADDRDRHRPRSAPARRPRARGRDRGHARSGEGGMSGYHPRIDRRRDPRPGGPPRPRRGHRPDREGVARRRWARRSPRTPGRRESPATGRSTWPPRRACGPSSSPPSRRRCSSACASALGDDAPPEDRLRGGPPARARTDCRRTLEKPPPPPVPDELREAGEALAAGIESEELRERRREGRGGQFGAVGSPAGRPVALIHYAGYKNSPLAGLFS